MTIEINGHADSRFAPVREAFRSNFEDLSEIGAALCIYSGERPVVDLWGGFKSAAKEDPWVQDTIVNVYSVSKGVTATCVHMLVDRGLIDLDTPVASYWPEFSQNGKESATVRHILSHTAGVPAFEELISYQEFFDWDVAVGRLAEQAPRWEPGSRLGYQPSTYGHLAGELIRRVSGRTPGEFVRSELAKPLGGDFFFGVGREHHGRIADLVPPPPEEVANWGAPDPESMVGKALRNPDVGDSSVANSAAWRCAQLPGTNGHGDARTVARMYAALANGGSIDGARLMSRESVEQAISEQISGVDCVMQLEGRMALGYALSGGFFQTTPSPRAFGYPGLGGHMAFGDPDAGLGFAYVANQMRIPADFVDPRVARLLDAVNDCL